MLIISSELCYYMAFRAILIGIVITVVLVSCGCISDTNDNGITARPTIDDAKWEQVVDHTYVLTATAGDLDHAVIPVVPNTAYRLKIEGQKLVEVSINPHEEDLYDSHGNVVAFDAKYVIFASEIYRYDGMIRTDPYQKNLEIRWVRYSGDPKMAGTTQNVHVVLERYNGDPSILPETTTEERGRITR